MQRPNTLLRADSDQPREDDPLFALDAEVRAKRAARVARAAQVWEQIKTAGNVDAWITQQLAQQGVLVGEDPSTLSDAEKKTYKERKKAEATAKRNLQQEAWRAHKSAHIVHLGVKPFWNDLVDIDKFDLERREERAKELGLPAWKGADDLAKALGVSISRLRWLAYHRDVDNHSHYRRFTIPKRSGGTRIINAPKRVLKGAQRTVLREVIERLTVHHAAHGFLADRSIKTNALVHAGADVIVKVDIKDFFPTVSLPRVKGLLRKAGMSEQLATLLGLLCTEAPRDIVEFRGDTWYVATGPRALPQGSPASPAITNALCHRLDRRLSGLARKLGCVYTRYADDLTFSWRKPAEDAAARAPKGTLLHGVQLILREEGFTLHPDKTVVMGRGTRQVVTGLVINRAQGANAVRVPREVMRRLRAAIHNRKKGKPGKADETVDQLIGMAAFVHMVDPVKGKRFLEQLKALPAG
jgi:RNA-directed DNA polymerase